MYSIYTTIYGICVPEELNRKLQKSDLSELLGGVDGLPVGFSCDIPYSGDGLADVHLGVEIDSTDSRSRKVVLEPTLEQKTMVEQYMPVVKAKFLEGIAELKEENPDWDDPEEMAVVDEFVALLDSKDYIIYRAYSTS